MTNEVREEILKGSYIPEEQWEFCFINPETNQVFTPLYENGEMIKTGEEVFNQWVYLKENPPTPKKTPEEEIEELKLKLTEAEASVIENKTIAAELAIMLADLQIEVYKL